MAFVGSDSARANSRRGRLQGTKTSGLLWDGNCRMRLALAGIRLRRDSWVSVMYAEELNSTKSSGFLQRTDRHGMLGQKPADFQLFL